MSTGRVTSVKVACPTCRQEVLIRPDLVCLWRCVNRPGRDFYAFTCISCGDAVAKPATLETVTLLTGAGVPRILYRLPDEVEDRARHLGPWTAYEQFDLVHDIQALDGAGEMANG